MYHVRRPLAAPQLEHTKSTGQSQIPNRSRRCSQRAARLDAAQHIWCTFGSERESTQNQTTASQEKVRQTLRGIRALSVPIAPRSYGTPSSPLMRDNVSAR
eukprot:9298820-Pyramimonas_sp.AAC.1